MQQILARRRNAKMWTKVLSTLLVGFLFASCAVAWRHQQFVQRAGVLPVEPNCGAPHLNSIIHNGYNTAINAYPWMALLVYVDKYGQHSFRCAGSLINNRYVVTAAHCVKKFYDESFKPTMVRLGEYDTSRRVDCILGYCNNPVVEVGIENIVFHRNYNSQTHNDIALLRLDREVEFTAFIKPVCLPLANASVLINTNDMLTGSGWGQTVTASSSQIKQAVEVPVYDQNDCARKFGSLGTMIIESQLCAGGVFQRGICFGDSGGPLMRQSSNSYYYLEGIASLTYRCGLENWPGVYTRVADFIDWIQANVLA